MTKSNIANSVRQLPPGSSLPQHVAVIMDGNGRWATQRRLPRIAGHSKGVKRVRELVSACGENGIKYLTLFAFSSENWRRPKLEVKSLIELFVSALDEELEKLQENNIKFRVIGDIDRFGKDAVRKIKNVEGLTRDNEGLMLTIAANYGGRWDIAQACAKLARRAQEGKIEVNAISPEMIAAFLSMHDTPDPDLFIRTGGEQRVSNFLLWQLAYAELYFTPILWPDFDHSQFDLALDSYSARQRRFGLTGEQIEAARQA